MTPDPEDTELLARVAATAMALRRTIEAAGAGPGIAAAACAELAGEHVALFAASQGLPPGPLLDEVTRVMRRRGAAVHAALRPDEPVMGGQGPR